MAENTTPKKKATVIQATGKQVTPPRMQRERSVVIENPEQLAEKMTAGYIEIGQYDKAEEATSVGAVVRRDVGECITDDLVVRTRQWPDPETGKIVLAAKVAHRPKKEDN